MNQMLFVGTSGQLAALLQPLDVTLQLKYDMMGDDGCVISNLTLKLNNY